MLLVGSLLSLCYEWDDTGIRGVEVFFKVNAVMIVRSVVEDIYIMCSLNNSSINNILRWLLVCYLTNLGLTVYGVIVIPSIKEENRQLAQFLTAIRLCYILGGLFGFCITNRLCNYNNNDERFTGNRHRMRPQLHAYLESLAMISEKESECAICLEQISVGKKVIKLECGEKHIFHD